MSDKVVKPLGSNERDVFGLTVLKNNHASIRKLKREIGNATIHGNKFWQSASLLIDYLTVNPPKPQMRILEVGCGWGISGIYCAKRYQSHVTALDADDSVFPYLALHAALNNVEVSTMKARFEQVTSKQLAEYDMVIGSDICFWDEMAKPLFNLIRRAEKAGVERVVLTDPGRQPFRDMAERCLEHYDAIYDNWSVPHPYNISGLILDI